MNTADFQEIIWDYYRHGQRDMPWRESPTFYNVLVSELMLQQTQVPRVIPKFHEFMETFPTMNDLAAAALSDVIAAWQGLGYNRRARFVHEAAQSIVKHGAPHTQAGLMQLPGVGINTAAAVMNYVYNEPTPFVETNIRTVYIHHFFRGEQNVSDKQIYDAVVQTIDTEHPREWFWALMDYGSFLKQQGLGQLSASKHYKKQSQLKGSIREMRGWIIKELTLGTKQRAALVNLYNNDDRIDAALAGLQKDGLVQEQGGWLHLTK